MSDPTRMMMRPVHDDIFSSASEAATPGRCRNPDSGDPYAGTIGLTDGRNEYEGEPDYRCPQPAVVARIAVGDQAGDIVVSPDGLRVYVARSESIAVINSAHQIVGAIRTGGYPRDLTIDADGWLIASDNGSVSIIDLTHHRAGVISDAVHARAVDAPAGGFIYAAHHATIGRRSGSWVSVFDSGGAGVATTVVTVGVDDHAISGLAVNHDGTRVYAGLSRRSPYHQEDAGFISVLDTATHEVVATIDTAASPDTMTVSPDGSRMYATHYDREFVSAIDLDSHRVTRIAVGDNPLGLVVTPDGSQAYVVSRSLLSVVDTFTNELDRVVVGDLPRCVRVSPDGKRAYVSNFGDRTVSVIDTIDRCVTEAIDVGSHPEVLALSPDGDRLYVCDNWSGTVTVVRT